MFGTARQFCIRLLANKRGYMLINIIGVAYSIITISSLLYVGSETCPELEGDRCTYFINVGAFVVFESVLNIICFHYFAYRNRLDYIIPASVSSWRTEVTQNNNNPSESTKFCGHCNRAVPKRSHHCPVCGYCILKNDHHCFALGGCVGFGTQRYFVVFLFWATIGGLFGAWMVARHINRVIAPFWPFGLLDYFFPLAIIKWVMFQPYPFTDLGYAMLITMGYIGGSGALVFFIFQWILILKGKTMMEMYTAKKKRLALNYDKAPASLRIEEVFGRYWYLNFLVPLPCRNRLDDSLNRFLYEQQLKGV